MGIFLECLSLDCTNSSYEVSAEFCIENQTDRKNDTIRRLSGTRQFCYDSRCWGFSSFIDWQRLENEYISNNRMKIVVKVWWTNTLKKSYIYTTYNPLLREVKFKKHSTNQNVAHCDERHNLCYEEILCPTANTCIFICKSSDYFVFILIHY